MACQTWQTFLFSAFQIGPRIKVPETALVPFWSCFFLRSLNQIWALLNILSSLARHPVNCSWQRHNEGGSMEASLSSLSLCSVFLRSAVHEDTYSGQWKLSLVFELVLAPQYCGCWFRLSVWWWAELFTTQWQELEGDHFLSCYVFLSFLAFYLAPAFGENEYRMWERHWNAEKHIQTFGTFPCSCPSKISWKFKGGRIWQIK